MIDIQKRPDKESPAVPCNGCTRCCHRDVVRLLAHEDASAYQTEAHPAMQDTLMLAHKPNGDCIYLEGNGCSIHDRRPQLCRDMDCRRIAAALTFTQARKADHRHVITLAVWRRGKELLRATH